MHLPLPLPPQTRRPFDVVGFGLNSVDLLVVVSEHPLPDTKQRVEAFARSPGGQAATAMVACQRLGWRARYIGSFGDDEHGRLSRESLEAAGVDVSACRTVPGVPNQFAVILVEPRHGYRTVLWDRHPALAMRPEEVPQWAVTSGRILLVDCHDTEAATTAARYARAAGMRTVIDVERVRPGIDALLREIDVIIAAAEFPSQLTGEPDLGRALRAMARTYPAAVVCATLGAEGSLAVVGDREIRTPAFSVPVVDTTGAGDVFRAGFISAWLAAGETVDVEMLLAYANAVAALNCRALGARAGIPTAAEVEQLLAAQSR